MKSSVYLTEKCETLSKVLLFFLEGGYNKTVSEKLAVFLLQIDFWDWEMDNLVYSFTNFEDRSKAWEHFKGIPESLKNLGFLVNDNRFMCYAFDIRQIQERNEVSAPFNELNKVIGKWNDVLSVCEDKLLISKEKAKSYVTLGAQIMPNLDKYRKKLK